MLSWVEKNIRIGQFNKRKLINMNFSEIPKNPFIFLSWVTALGLFLSLIEASIKLKFEKINSNRRKEDLINKLYPKKLA